MKKTITANQIEEAINALHIRVIAEIDRIGTAEASRKTKITKQQINILQRFFRDPDKAESKIKFDTLKKYAEKLGIE